MRRLALAAVMLVALTTPMLAQDAAPAYIEGVEAYYRGDYATALRVYKAHAALGNADAQLSLGSMYYRGKGVPQDYAEAVKWFRLAAEQGDPDAQLSLGAKYAKGEGVPQDYVLAHMWSNLAAAQGNEWARKKRDLVAKKMTPADISKAQKLAREWMEKHGQ